MFYLVILRVVEFWMAAYTAHSFSELRNRLNFLVPHQVSRFHSHVGVSDRAEWFLLKRHKPRT